jgi:CubicO group peptidase (beta-lactamase class C family)
MTLNPALVVHIEETRDRYHVPGVAVGILHNDSLHMGGFGVTNVDHPLPVSEDTLFQIGSITKTMTAMAAMRLVEAGKLDLDQPLRAYLPDLRFQDEEAAARVTLRHCFTHTGGWLGDYFDDLGPGDDALARYVAAMADLPQITPLGELWSYNNAAFGLAGRVMEVVTEKPFEQIIQEWVLDPLGMTQSFFFAADAITHRVVAGHLVVDLDDPAKTRAEVARPWALARTAHSAGGIISSVRDMLRYARFHLGDGVTEDGRRLLSPGSMALMHSELVAAGSGTKATGIAWMINEAAGMKTIGHGGATRGQMANLLLVPEESFAIVVLTNSSQGSSLHREVTASALEQYLGIERKESALQTLSPDQLAEYRGRYTAKLTHLTIHAQDGGLRVEVAPQGGFPKKETPPPPAPLPMSASFYDADKVIVTDGAARESKGDFIRDASGQIVWFRFGGRIHRKED